VGLVIMLSNMDDPAAIGPGMAVALLTTLYGAVIANALALPLADRLARRSAEEVLYRTIIIKGVMSIQSGDNPRIVEQKLRTYLPPKERTEEENKEAA
jgi:chemotaxis protein MotA